MISISLAQSDQELRGIIALQTVNLPKNISAEEAESQGFVTVVHDFDILKKMNNDKPHIIAKSGDQVVGYCLAMTKKFKKDIPVLVPMFDKMDEQVYKGRLVKDYNYIVCGQVCVAKSTRGQGVFDRMYHHYQDAYSVKYNLILTEIAERNQRSIRAHYRVGFETLIRYKAANGEDWEVVVWDWRTTKGA